MPIDIHREDVQQMMLEGAQLVEVMPVQEFSEAHLPEAVNIPLKELNARSVKSLDPIRPVITYCNDFQ